MAATCWPADRSAPPARRPRHDLGLCRIPRPVALCRPTGDRPSRRTYSGRMMVSSAESDGPSRRAWRSSRPAQPVGVLVESIPTPRRDHRQNEDAALTEQS